jgi:hypothetical protein
MADEPEVGPSLPAAPVTRSGASGPAGGSSARIDPLRDPAALSNAISRRWRPYRFRAYVLGVLAGLFFGGFVAPFATVIISAIVVVTTSLPALTVPWAEVVWTVVFVLVFARVGSWAIARWLPRDFGAATEAYLWLAALSEAHWRSVLGVPVPRTAAAQRAFLDATPVTPATAGQIGSIWLMLGDLDTALEVFAQMPESSPGERHEKTGALWLADFVVGGDDLGRLEASLRDVWDDHTWLEGAVEVAVDTSRVALAHGGDWIAPMAAVRPKLGDKPRQLMWRFAAEPAFKRMLALGSIGAISFWVFTLAR